MVEKDKYFSIGEQVDHLKAQAKNWSLKEREEFYKCVLGDALASILPVSFTRR